MVTSCVSSGQGFSLLTPTLLIDGLVENMNLKLQNLPVSGLSRTLTVVARQEELQDLPRVAAETCKRILVEQVDRQMGLIGRSSLDLRVSNIPPKI